MRDDPLMNSAPAGPRRPNARGQGELLRAEIVSAAVRLLGDLADDQTLSLRAVGHPFDLGEEGGPGLLQLTQGGAVAAEQRDAGRFGFGDPR